MDVRKDFKWEALELKILFLIFQILFLLLLKIFLLIEFIHHAFHVRRKLLC